jgi:mRNA-degrading endonuclease RelE of RelBE toxin-antitoxin system
MPWSLRVEKGVTRKLKRLPPKDRRLILEALAELERNPKQAALQPLRHQPTGYRLKVGNWRLPTDVYPELSLIVVCDLMRRTTTTYRKR